MLSDEIDPGLLDRYLAGDCSDQDRAVVDAWLAQQPSRRAVLDALRSTLGAGTTGRDTDAAWARLAARVGDDPADVPVSNARSYGNRTRRWPSLLRRAALITGLVLGGPALWHIMALRDTRASIATVIATTVGQRDTVSLPDGSTVILAPASRLEVAPRFGDRDRSVRLAGEAYFEIEHDVERPFRIATRSSRVVVLGTAFDVRAIDASANVVVAVREGRVSFSAASDSSAAIVLTQGQVGRLDGGAPRLVAGSSAGTWLAWLDGVLDFDDAPLSDVAGDIERWFGVDIRIADRALSSRRISGRFTTDSIDQVLDALSLTLGIDYERAGDGFVLHARPGGS